MTSAQELLHSFKELLEREERDIPQEEASIRQGLGHLKDALPREQRKIHVLEKAHKDLDKIFSVIRRINDLFHEGGKLVAQCEAEIYREGFMWKGDTPYDEIYKDLTPQIEEQMTVLHSYLKDIQSEIDRLPSDERKDPEIEYLVRILDYLKGRQLGDEWWAKYHYVYIKWKQSM